MAQIEEKKPPPNPAKVTDSRFESYVKRFGQKSWELDALEPAYLVKLVRKHLAQVIDEPTLAVVKEETEAIRGKLRKTADRFRKQGL